MPPSSAYYDELVVRIKLSTREYEEYYRGTAKYVLTYALDGRSVKFPAGLLRPYLSHNGIHGEFIIRFDQNQKLIDFRRLGE
ncbi:MAG: DUF2835 domain-containing protein [Gammaproteobacteria bacterium]|nr:DUF2835 domain-containing protein [Gammaproteobacteria bacterium]